MVEVIITVRDADVLLKELCIRCHVHKGQLKADGAVEEVQEGAPLLEDSSFILLLGQLIVDVLILNGFGVIPVADAADAIREHSLKRDGLLRGTGNAIVTPGPIHDLPDLPFLRLRQVPRHVQIPFLGSPEQTFYRKQCFLPPFLPALDGSRRRNSCSSGRNGP